MSLIEANRVDDLAHAMFDTVVAPLAERRQATGRPSHFPIRPDPSAVSYFEPAAPVSATGAQVAAFPGGGHAIGLIDALAAFWTEQGETDLAPLVPHLRKLAVAVAAERQEQSGDVDIYCYTMF